MNEMLPIRSRAKLFWTGRSQAVRLPKEFRFEGKEVRIFKEHGRVILEATPTKAVDDQAWLASLRGFDDDAAAAALDRPGPDHLNNALDDDPRFD